ncbi:IclR family transcriptional regulator [Thalassospira profundimaris]|uniref:IclR family transcriptional regulator n=1 Tax=Thalassospira profundimaris TaxID=502049 RepID=A0A367XD81_9PROT|nr:IclR family transcriptional regulator [Thalassospira profundimaris]RCK50741.1 IclR family transcriptional regulator [Thalassospira profundimaris]
MTGPEKPRQNTLYVSSLAKGLRILEVFSEERLELGLSEIARETGLDKSAAQRLVNTLHQLGYIDKNAETRRYRPALKYLDMAYAYLWSDNLVQLAMPRLIELSRQLQQTINLARPIEQHIMYVVRLPGYRTSYGASIIGRRVPALTASSGRVMLSRQDENTIRKCVNEWPLKQYTGTTTLDRQEILDSILLAREKGYCMSERQVLPDEINVAAPICTNDGKPVAAIHCSLPVIRWTQEKAEQEIVPHIVETARSISPPR